MSHRRVLTVKINNHMLSITKKFYFETAHAIHHYPGPCRHIHGHSYTLKVTVQGTDLNGTEWLSGTGMLMDFRELKTLVYPIIQEFFDHKLILSRAYIEANPLTEALSGLVVWDHEPTAENMLVYLSKRLSAGLPSYIRLSRLILFETKDSYAEWEAEE